MSTTRSIVIAVALLAPTSHSLAGPATPLVRRAQNALATGVKLRHSQPEVALQLADEVLANGSAPGITAKMRARALATKDIARAELSLQRLETRAKTVDPSRDQTRADFSLLNEEMSRLVAEPLNMELAQRERYRLVSTRLLTRHHAALINGAKGEIQYLEANGRFHPDGTDAPALRYRSELAQVVGYRLPFEAELAPSARRQLGRLRATMTDLDRELLQAFTKASAGK